MAGTTPCFVLATVEKNLGESGLVEEIRWKHKFPDPKNLSSNFMQYHYFRAIAFL
jgi:hypothetical protein